LRGLEMDEEILHEFDINASERIRFTVSHFNGKDYYHIRVYVHNTINGDKYLPTKKGIVMTRDVLDDFFQGVIRLEDKVEERS
jgi:hypothetical protein